MEIPIAIFHGLGDCVNATSLLRPLKNRFPNSNITWITSSKYAPLVGSNPLISKVIKIDGDPLHADKEYKNLKKKYKNLITPAPYMLPPSRNNQLLESFEDQAKRHAKYDGPIEPVLFVTQKEEDEVTTWLNSNNIKKYIMLECHYTSSQSYWAGNHTKILLEACGKAGITVLLTHRKEPNLNSLNAICKTYCLDFGFRSMPAFYNKAAGFIGVSSGISCITHTHQCKKDVPHLEFVNGEHWCTRRYKKKNKIIHFKISNDKFKNVINNFVKTIEQ